MNTEEMHILISQWSRRGYVIVEDGGCVLAVMKNGKVVLLFKREAA